ncbi:MULTISPECIES: Na/Pi cotransporter family protein [unclassified Acetobacterium]|jgi:phosphate:Na+ symporter|uniref:Na/Pi cotransporter family protein n=1 Tax=unclassified Acetobacterium TaxID=2638182 RepID=UPI000DBEC229|nr:MULTISPECIES: Na/Pi cotransporter family protein [unclassified Acetobacterium]AWW26427.1 Na/Pi cotransporter family protein [Acetobacterium sp. KB-1]MDZ5724863.1 Na/Pi cotransporter family protein [Acetobacterium sp. K1/6]
MTLEMLIGLFGGLGLFVFGMHMMSDGLKTVAGTKMKKLLEVLTNNKIKAILVGTVVTMIVQSSSTTTVMVVGFVNAALMTLTQAAGVILGANIGTTVTAQLIAFNVTELAPIFIGIGAMMALFSTKKKNKDLGSIILGFGILFYGIAAMSTAMKPLRESEEFIYLLSTYGTNPLLGVLIGTLITAVIQSSSASIGLLQALALSGVFVSIGGTGAIQICLPILIGTNIGTCVTALLSCIGTSTAAKKAAFIHLFVNIFGAVWVMILLTIMNNLVAVNPVYEFIVTISGSLINGGGDMVPNVARQIAMAHTLFNVANTIVLLPIIGYFVSFLDRVYPEKEEDKGLQLDDRLFNNPSIALGQVVRETNRLAKMSFKNFRVACESIMDGNEKLVEKIVKREERIDEFQQGIVEYSVKLSNENMSEEENERLAFILKGSHDLERIGDHAMNIGELAEMRATNKIVFSDIANQEVLNLISLTTNTLRDMVELMETEETDLCYKILDEEEEIDEMTEKLKDDHIRRLNEGICNPYAGVIFLDLLTNIERVGDHASNIAHGILGLKLHQGLISQREFDSETKVEHA